MKYKSFLFLYVFHANVSQVKLHNISFLLNTTSHQLSDDLILPAQNSKRNET